MLLLSPRFVHSILGKKCDVKLFIQILLEQGKPSGVFIALNEKWVDNCLMLSRKY